MMYPSSDVPEQVGGHRVLAFAPVLAHLPDHATAPSGALARVILPDGAHHFAVVSLAWQPDSGTWLQDGTQRFAGYAGALAALTRPRIGIREFSRTT